MLPNVCPASLAISVPPATVKSSPAKSDSTGSIPAAIKSGKPDAAVLCTSSSLKSVAGQFEEVLKHRVPIVTTTEEAAYPSKRNRRLAARIDAAARKAKVAVLGTGVNPGFTMDALPIALTAVCERVTSIEVLRVQDARIRRLPFQQKIGSGLNTDQFAQKVKDGSVRHVGLAESVTMIADAMGWKLDKVTDEIHPKLAESRVASAFLTVEPGQVAGIVQDGIGYRNGKPLVTLHMEAYLGAPESYDEVRIDGHPPLQVRGIGGYHGDVATAAIVVNTLPKVIGAPPGLHTMRSLPLPGYFGGRSF